jgi:tight adherence protein B
VKKVVVALCALAALVPGISAAAGPRISAVDVSAYPEVRATLVTPRPVARIPDLTENGVPVAGYEAANLGRDKSIVVAVDRSQSMQGQAILDASAAARAFIRSKPRNDRVAVVAVGKRAVLLTGFSSSRIDADVALRTLTVDEVRGTALYDSIVISSQALAADAPGARVLVLLTDGQEVTSDASLKEAIDAALDAGVAVYPIAIESPSFSPRPLKQLARATGGRYTGAASSAALHRIYTSLAEELRRTWRLTYVTSARPGEKIELAAAGTRASTVVPGVRVVVTPEPSRLPDSAYRVGPALVTALVAACVLLAGIFLLRAPVGSRLRRRITPHVGTGQSKAVRGPAEERFATASTLMRATERAFGHFRFWHALHRLLERADVPLRTVELVYAAVGFALGLGFLLALFGAGSFVTVIVMVCGGSLPILFVAWKARRRILAIEDQLPDLLITLAASLKAGHSFRQGIQAVVEEGEGPAGKEFKRVLTETRLGRPMDDALGEMADRVGSKNLRFVVTAVTIQRQVGGSLAGIFDMVAEAVRQRQAFARKIRSLTAMGRMSAYVLAGIPIFLLGAVTLLNKEYMDPLYTTSTGHRLMLVGATMMVFGSLILRKIVSFKG